jgi:hypothetical protein
VVRQLRWRRTWVVVVIHLLQVRSALGLGVGKAVGTSVAGAAATRRSHSSFMM